LTARWRPWPVSQRREAKTLASLNHPNIAIIHGLEQAGDVHALVMELVEGEDLSQRIVRGAIPLDEALPIAKQIAEALEAAHAHGIIHRDLKPANIKVRADGTVKVLDFGLAKAMEPVGAMSASASMSPTITTPAMTQAGMILGTAAYMSPEQARGKVVDKRADIWTFGCVLYEMLTGRRAFDGEDVTEVLAFLITKEPDWNALPPATPTAIRALLKGCLEKKSRERVADISTALFVLKEHVSLAAPGGTTSVAPLARTPLWRRVAVVGAAALLVGALVSTTVTWVAMRPAEPVPPCVSRFTLAPSGAAALSVSSNFRDLAITPDGSRVIYVGNRGTQLFVRALDALEPVAVFTGGPHGPFVSPDGHWIGFVDGASSLKKVALTGGPAVTLATVDGTPRGATWAPDDTIIFATPNATTGLQRVAAAGGPVTVLTRPDCAQGEGRHLWPDVLPGGRAVLFTITALVGGPDAAQVAVLDLQTGTRKVLVRGGSHAHYVPSTLGSRERAEREGGHLVYAAGGTLRAVPFDLAILEMRGTPVPVVPEVVTTANGGVYVVVGDDGTLAYVSGSGGAAAPRTLVWVDRQGRETPIPAPPRTYAYPRLSPDGTRVAVEVRDQEWDIWIVSLASTTLTRFSFGPATDRLPVWTPDGRRIVWSSERDGAANMYWQSADGSGSVERLLQSTNPQFSSALSPDGTRLVFRQDTATRDLMVVAMDAAPRQTDPGRGQPPTPREAQPLLQTPFTETSAEISPDGRWIAYQSDESGQDEIYARPFPDVDAGRWQVSTRGGTKPLWARSGRELFYLVPADAGAAVMSAPIGRGPIFAAGTPTRVLEGPYFFGTSGVGDVGFRTYDVGPDGQRFLMIKEGGGAGQTAAPASLIVVLNWVEELKRLVPAK
jgi:serine/threonine-protein kinase